jgi:HEPN domain-containing protein
VLTLYEIDFPYTHNLQRLLEFIPVEFGGGELLLSATVLTEFAIITRYPGELEPVSVEYYHRLVSLAEQIYDWALNVVTTQLL